MTRALARLAFLTVLAVAAAALARWVDTRYGEDFAASRTAAPYWVE
jgi:hypothetical protein